MRGDKKRRLRCLGVGPVAGALGGLFAGAGVFAIEDAGALEEVERLFYVHGLSGSES